MGDVVRFPVSPPPERMEEIFQLADEVWEQREAEALREANASHAWLAQHPPDWAVIAAARAGRRPLRVVR
jgi:hypothetical protein